VGKEIQPAQSLFSKSSCEERETLLHCWWDCKLVKPFRKIIWKFHGKLEIDLLKTQLFGLKMLYNATG
jgi:hypothetical protein